LTSTPPLCTACVYATLVYPESAAKFYHCGNPAYVITSPVDGGKTYYDCSMARRYRDLCGPAGKGFLAHTPEFKRPAIRRLDIERAALKHLWHQRRNFVDPWYWPYLRDHTGHGNGVVRHVTRWIFGALCWFRERRHARPS
jgi:hypothetical protein